VKKTRNFIAVDETVIKINGRKRFLWVAIDAESRAILAVWMTRSVVLSCTLLNSLMASGEKLLAIARGERSVYAQP